MSQTQMQKSVCAHFSELSVFHSISSQCLLFGAVLWKVRFQCAIAFASIQTQIGLEAIAYPSYPHSYGTQ